MSTNFLRVGTRYDGLPVDLCWPFLPHTLVSGITGSGKSSWTASLIGEAAAMKNTAIVGIDLKRVELTGWTPRLTTLATTPDSATKSLSGLQQLVDHRSDILQNLGLRTWTPDLGPSVLVIIDELAELAAIDNKTIAEAIQKPDDATKILRSAKGTASLRIDMLASLGRLARFAAISIVCATQYPLANIVSSELRANLTGRIGGRVTSEEQINVSLGNGMSQHISPSSISPADKGIAYVLGFEGFDRPIRCRANYPTDTQIADRADHTRHLQIPETQLFNLGEPKAA